MHAEKGQMKQYVSAVIVQNLHIQMHALASNVQALADSFHWCYLNALKIKLSDLKTILHCYSKCHPSFQWLNSEPQQSRNKKTLEDIS